MMAGLRRAACDVLCLAAYALLAALGTYPLVLYLSDALPRGGDSWVYYWNLWWVRRALFDLQTTPYVTPDLYFPYGASLYFHTLNLLPSLLAVPVVALFGLTVGYNFLVFLSFILTGYGTYRLVCYVLTDEAGSLPGVAGTRLAAFLAGVVFTFSSYRYAHLLGHLDLMSTQWLPLFALFMLKTVREPGWRNPLYAALFLVAAALTTSYYLLFLVVFAGVLALWSVVTRGRDATRIVLRAAASLALAVMLLAPVLIPMVTMGVTQGRTPNPSYDIDRYSGDLLGFVLPPPWSPVAVRSLNAMTTRHDSGYETVMFLGFVPLLLAAVGLISRRIRGFWLAAMMIFAALALGPLIHVVGRPFPMPSMLTPYEWLAGLPYGDIPRVPARFVVMVMLCLSVLAGAGARRIMALASRRVLILLMALASALTLLENAFLPLPLSVVRVPPYFVQLGEHAGRRGLVEVPIPEDPSRYPRRMLHQTVHRKPVYGGYLARGLPPLPFPAVPGFGQFARLSSDVDDVVPYAAAELPAISRAVLNAYDAGHLVIEKSLLDAPSIERARIVADALLGSQSRVHEDDETLAYAISEAPSTAPLAIWLDAWWSYLERLGSRDPDDRATRWRWMGSHARLGLVSPAATAVRLKINARAFDRPRRLRFTLRGAEVALLRVGPDRRDYETPPFPVPAGTSFIDVTSLDGADSPGVDPRRLSVAFFRLELLRP
jgi:hypothetical protein